MLFHRPEPHTPRPPSGSRSLQPGRRSSLAWPTASPSTLLVYLYAQYSTLIIKLRMVVVRRSVLCRSTSKYNFVFLCTNQSHRTPLHLYIQIQTCIVLYYPYLGCVVLFKAGFTTSLLTTLLAYIRGSVTESLDDGCHPLWFWYIQVQDCIIQYNSYSKYVVLCRISYSPSLFDSLIAYIHRWRH